MRLVKTYLACAMVCLGASVRAAEYRHPTWLLPDDYLFQSFDMHRDPVFDDYKTIDLSASVGVGSDCGRMDFTNTLRASLRNVLDAKYFADIGKSIIGSSPMLLTCYFSPTWCAILKHSQISAHYLSQLRLDQCQVIDKYVDSRVEDYYQERQRCVHRAIDQNGGDLEHAMESCGGDVWNADLTNWAGRRNGEKTSQNRLLESSAKWAGFDGLEAKKTLGLVKALVGDTVVSQGGGISVEYGPESRALTPRTYLQSLEKATYAELCGRIGQRLEDAPEGTNPDSLVTEHELKALSPSLGRAVVDRQTIRALAAMPPRERAIACKTLADAVAMTVFSNDVNRSLDMLTTLAQNPNLPDNRRREIEQKRRALKDSIDATVSLQRQRNTPLGAALSQINERGSRLQERMVRDALSVDGAAESMKRTQSEFMDCSDGVMCDGR